MMGELYSPPVDCPWIWKPWSHQVSLWIWKPWSHQVSLSRWPGSGMPADGLGMTSVALIKSIKATRRSL